jgi:hypothetical protein
MRSIVVTAASLILAATVGAGNLGPRPPIKPTRSIPPNAPAAERQGGDTILDAVPLTLPVIDLAGTTTGYADNYDIMCPYGSNSPDVVYSIVPASTMLIDIDLCGSAYDTKIIVYDENGDFYACNDDFYFDDECGTYVSKVEELPVTGGAEYFVVIDGYGGDHGEYLLDILEHAPCVVDCPTGYPLEGEPPLVEGYVDLYNGGCGSPQHGNPFGTITTQEFCGESGWYVHASGLTYRDTDWFELVVPGDGLIEIWGDAEESTTLYQLAPLDCANVAIVQEATIGPCTEGTFLIAGPPGSTVWLWVGPSTWKDPATYNYVFFGHGTATENHTWTDVKALFR